MRRARALRGQSLNELAQHLARPLPADPMRSKGWTGALLEEALGAESASLPVPDFAQIHVELKTVPVTVQGAPVESTFVTSASPQALAEESWEGSRVWSKLQRVLWFPIATHASLPFADRRLGVPLLWTPSSDEAHVLQEDWELLAGRVGAGLGQITTAKDGAALQLRPKAASSRSRRWAVDSDGALSRHLPLGFYLRATFVGAILQRCLERSVG